MKKNKHFYKFISILVILMVYESFGQSIEIEGDGSHNNIVVQGKYIRPKNADKVGIYGEGSLHGINSIGGYTGVWGQSNIGGTGSRYGARGVAYGGASKNVGVYGKASGTNAWAGYFSGDIYATSFSPSPSDRRFKHNFKPATNCLLKVKKLKPKFYQFRTDEFPNENFPTRKQIGFLGQDVEMEFPGAIKKFKVRKKLNSEKKSIVEDLKKGSEIEDDYIAVDYVKLIPALIGAMQEQQKQIDRLKKMIEE